MLRLLSTVIGQSVISQRESRALGRVEEVVANAAKGSIVAYRTSASKPYLSTVDVIAYLDDGLVVQDDSVLQNEDDLIRLKQLGVDRTSLLGLKVVSDTGRRIGKLNDVLIDTAAHQITRLHIRPPIWRRLHSSELIIPRERVIRMSATEVVVRYDNGARPAGAEPEVA